MSFARVGVKKLTNPPTAPRSTTGAIVQSISVLFTIGIKKFTCLTNTKVTGTMPIWAETEVAKSPLITSGKNANILFSLGLNITIASVAANDNKNPISVTQLGKIINITTPARMVFLTAPLTRPAICEVKAIEARIAALNVVA